MIETSTKTHRVMKFIWTRYDYKKFKYETSMGQDLRRPWQGMDKDGHGINREVKILR